MDLGSSRMDGEQVNRLLIVFGLALMGTGIFQHRPIVEGLSFNMLEDHLHSSFSFDFSSIFSSGNMAEGHVLSCIWMDGAPL